jgi:glycosyltransferase involved in cell wall biosynthesis
MAPRASVILSTYNQPRLLDLALASYARQSCVDFELLVADDGSGPETGAVIERHARGFPVRLERVWQPDDGFRKALACNRAVLESRGALLVFSDGDCLASRTFVEQHLAAGGPNRFAVGGHIRLSPEYTERLTLDDVRSGAFERAGSLAERLGLWATHAKSLGYIAVGKPRKPKLYGMNFAVDRESFYRVNGYDNAFAGSAKEDSDLRNRLRLAGVRPTSLWHRARVFHQHHGPNMGRVAWKEAEAYYNRADLQPVAASGLREVAGEGLPGTRAFGDARSPTPLRSV